MAYVITHCRRATCRRLRIEYPGAIYHVISRGIGRRKIFKEDKDCRHLVQLLKECVDFLFVKKRAAAFQLDASGLADFGFSCFHRDNLIEE